MPDEPALEPEEPVDTGYSPTGVPTFESVREKIETRYGTAIGSAELDAETPEGRTVEEQYDALMAERLEVRPEPGELRADADIAAQVEAFLAELEQDES